MTYAELLLLTKHYHEEKEYLENGYFRIRQKDPQHYELAFLKVDGCGTTSVSPQITVEVIDEQVRAIGLMDMYAAPIRIIVQSEETADLLEQELSQLVTKFKLAKKI